MSSASSLQPIGSLQPKIIGVGNAGVSFLDRLLLSTPSFSGLIAVNNDSEALAASVVTTQISLSTNLEPEAALAESTTLLAEQIAGASVVLLCGGLGGALASNLLPRIAEMSKAAKVLTVACVTLPFAFEGKRAQSAALESLAALQQICDGIILLDNNILVSKAPSTAGFGETFLASDEAMQECLPAFLAMLMNKGPVRIPRAHLLKTLHRPGVKTGFGYGQATGANRLHQAVERALKNSLLDRGRALAKADSIFILLRGPKDLSFAEAQAVMQEVERFATGEHDIQLSVQAEEPEGAPLQLFILAVAAAPKPKVQAALPGKVPEPVNADVPREKNEEFSLKLPVQMTTQKTTQLNAPLSEEDTHFIQISPPQEGGSEPVPFKELFPTEVYQKPLGSGSTAQEKAAKPKQTQGALNLTAAQRGRFDKSEPTIVEGEDLDTPTYLRLGLKLG